MKPWSLVFSCKTILGSVRNLKRSRGEGSFAVSRERILLGFLEFFSSFFRHFNAFGSFFTSTEPFRGFGKKSLFRVYVTPQSQNSISKKRIQKEALVSVGYLNLPNNLSSLSVIVKDRDVFSFLFSLNISKSFVSRLWNDYLTFVVYQYVGFVLKDSERSNGNQHLIHGPSFSFFTSEIDIFGCFPADDDYLLHFIYNAEEEDL